MDIKEVKNKDTKEVILNEKFRLSMYKRINLLSEKFNSTASDLLYLTSLVQYDLPITEEALKLYKELARKITTNLCEEANIVKLELNAIVKVIENEYNKKAEQGC